jgi:hypothetical protein
MSSVYVSGDIGVDRVHELGDSDAGGGNGLRGK